jgi:hypothetical protein
MRVNAIIGKGENARFSGAFRAKTPLAIALEYPHSRMIPGSWNANPFCTPRYDNQGVMP